MSTQAKIHLVYGATASGKSAYALSEARANGGVIINADSQQIYRELRILTARPSNEDEDQVPHKLYGALAGNDPADVAKWLKLVKMEIDWAITNNQPAYVVGGTGMYINALIHGIAEIPEVPKAVLQQAKNDLEYMGKLEFFERLRVVDPEICGIINAGDSQRMIRAYSVWLASGKAISYWKKQGNVAMYPLEYFVHHPIELPRQTLYERCELRVQQMMIDGGIKEVQQLLAYGYDSNLPIMRIIGVRQLGGYLSGVSTKEDAIKEMQQATRNFAKRQLTWFRNQMPSL